MYYVTAAAVVRSVRERAALSQRTLAERAETTQAAIARIEADRTKPTIETLRRLVSAAGFDLQLNVVERTTADPVVDAYKPGVDQTLLIEQLRKTPRERIQSLMAMQQFAEHVAHVGRESRRKVAEAAATYGGKTHGK